MNSSAIRIDLLNWTKAAPLVMPLRIAVFVTEQGVPLEIEADEWDAVCLHAVARTATEEVIGTGRLRIEASTGYIGRMAVAKTWRQQHIGGQILTALVRAGHTHQLNTLRLHAQTHATAFYERHGFTPEGAVFMEAGIPHQEMHLTLPPAT